METRARAEESYVKWKDSLPPEMRKFFAPVVTMMKSWGPQIFNFYEGRYTNGPLERMNRSINDLSSDGYGYDFCCDMATWCLWVTS
jgi:hypothetical protein